MTEFPIGLHQPVEHGGPLPETADVVIIGAGIIGVMTAYYLAQKGLKPVVVEKGRVAGEQSSRNWGWLRQMGRDPAELPIMMEASRLWNDLQRETGEDLGLKHCGLTYLAQDQQSLARYERWLASVAGSGVDSRILSAAEVATLLPGYNKPFAGALHTPSDMRAEPWLAVPALARAATRKGAVIVEACAARVIETAAGQVSGLWTEQGFIAAPQVVVAGGAWSALFLRRHGINIPQLSVRATVVATAPLPDIYLGGAVDSQFAFRRREDGGYSLAPADFHDFWTGPDALRHFRAFLPQLRADPFGRRYRPAAPRDYPDAWGTRRKWCKDEQSPFERMRVLNPAPNQRIVAKLLRQFAGRYPEIGPVTAQTAWAGMIDTLPDVVPVVDHAETMPGLSICTGMCGHGFGIGPGFGRIMADLVTGDAPGHDLTRFRLSRFCDGSRLQIAPEV